MATFTKVAMTSEVPENSGRTFSVAGKELAVFNVDGAFYAISNFCPHRGGPLGEGFLEGTTVFCPWHGWGFNVTSGKMPGMPDGGVRTYPVQVEGDEILVEV